MTISTDLFGGTERQVVTEGIKYAGSKLKILPHILAIAQDLPIKSVLDGFSGTTRVSQAFAQMGYNTTSNDIADWSRVFGICYLLSNNRPDSYYQPMLDELNTLPGCKGWFSEMYGSDSVLGKRPFQLHNTMKLDAIRQKIEEWQLDEIDKSVLLTSLILAMDSVDNTLGHYAAYLSGWSQRSYQPMRMMLPKRAKNYTENQVLQKDVFSIKDSFDLAYFDPPYGSNNDKMPPSRVRYSSYYHIWKTIVLNDCPKVFGKANRREDSRDTYAPSVFESYKKNDSGRFVALDALDRLLEQVNAHFIILSYSSGGRATKDELCEIIHQRGTLRKVFEIDHRLNVMARMNSTYDWTRSAENHKEFLFLMEK